MISYANMKSELSDMEYIARNPGQSNLDSNGSREHAFMGNHPRYKPSANHDSVLKNKRKQARHIE